MSLQIQQFNDRSSVENIKSENLKSGLFFFKGLYDSFFDTKSDASIRQKLKFQLSMDKPNVLATIPRSGYHWFSSVLTSTLEYDLFGNADFDLVGDHYRHKLKFDSTLQDFRGISVPDKCLYYHTHYPYYKIKSLKRYGGKKVILIRHPYEQQKSYFRFCEFNKDKEEIYRKTDSIQKAIDFYNSWYLYLKKHPEKCLLIKYEDLMRNPEIHFNECFQFFEIEFTEKALREGIRTNDRNNVLKKVNSDNIDNKCITVDRTEKFTEEMKEYILNSFREDLISDFGYKLE